MELLKLNYSSDSETEKLPELPDHIVYKYEKTPTLTQFSNMSKLNFKKYNVFMFLEVRLKKDQVDFTNTLLHDVNNLTKNITFTPLHYGKLNAMLPLHISLSPTLDFPNIESRDQYVHDFINLVSKKKLQKFDITLQPNWKLVPNYDNSIWFLTLGVDEKTKKKITPLVECVENAAKLSSDVKLNNFNNFYLFPHISIGKDEGNSIVRKLLQENNLQELRKEMEKTNQIIKSSIILHPYELELMHFKCSSIKVKKNYDIISIPLM